MGDGGGGGGVDTGGREASMTTRKEVGGPGLSEHASEFQATAYGLHHDLTLPLQPSNSHRQHGNKHGWLSSKRHLFTDTKIHISYSFHRLQNILLIFISPNI